MPETSTPQSEQFLISRAKDAVSSCNWVVGECASQWTEKYARGRTDADFAALVGMTPDQVYQRRRVWETFGDVNTDYGKLRWSHFYVALNWDNAPECLQWADENEATVAEMKAWRRLQLGEDLSTLSEADDLKNSLVSFVPTEPVEVRDPGTFEGAPFETAGAPRENGDRSATVSAAAREMPGEDYAPFRQGASAAPAPAGGTAVAERPQPTVEQIVKRMTGSLLRCSKAIDPRFRKEFGKLPEKLRESFFAAVAELDEVVQELK